jgi:hypothetical protein
MAKRRKPASRPPARKAAPGPAAREVTPKRGAAAADEKAFIDSLIAHGQAAKRRPDGTLPTGATHELIEDENGERRVVRRRFSAL